jgi:hypothetical protein
MWLSLRGLPSAIQYRCAFSPGLTITYGGMSFMTAASEHNSEIKIIRLSVSVMYDKLREMQYIIGYFTCFKTVVTTFITYFNTENSAVSLQILFMHFTIHQINNNYYYFPSAINATKCVCKMCFLAGGN